MEDFNPHELDAAILRTAIENLEADECYQAAVKLAQDVQDLHAFVAETPRWASLFDQAQRASSSVALNYGQGLGKLKGHCGSDWLCARGELIETIAALTIGPPSFKALAPAAKELYRLLDRRLLSLVKPQPEHFKRYGR